MAGPTREVRCCCCCHWAPTLLSALDSENTPCSWLRSTPCRSRMEFLADRSIDERHHITSNHRSGQVSKPSYQQSRWYRTNDIVIKIACHSLVASVRMARKYSTEGAAAVMALTRADTGTSTDSAMRGVARGRRGVPTIDNKE